MNAPLFDPKKFGKRVAYTISKRGTTIRQVAKDIGISHASVHRVTQGLTPSVELYLRLKKWMEEDG